MAIRLLLSFLLLTAFTFTACKKDKGESIDYNVLAEKRILEVSEQTTISDSDIASLERLLENVTNASLQTKLTNWLVSVKEIQSFLTELNTLKTDPDINFSEAYAKLEVQLTKITDELPRKAKLKDDLQKAKDNYNAEEYEYPASVMDEHNNSNLRTFLKEVYQIEHVSGKLNSFYKADIDRVDSLVLYVHSNVQVAGMVPDILKTFKNLKYLNTSTLSDDVFDLNRHTKLETLIVNYITTLKIEECQNLKHLEITGGKWGETIDFTDKYPLLETLILPWSISQNLVTVLLPNKTHLKEVVFNDEERLGYSKLPNIKRLVVEATHAITHPIFWLGSSSNKEIDYVKLTGFEGHVTEDFLQTSIIIQGNPVDPSVEKFVRIKELVLENIHSINLSYLELPNGNDLSKIASLKRIFFGSVSVTVGDAPPKPEDLFKVADLNADLETLILFDFTGEELDLTRFNHLKVVGILYNGHHPENKKLKKLKVKKYVTELGNGSCNNCIYQIDENVEVEVVD